MPSFINYANNKHLKNHNLEGQSVEQFGNPVFTGITKKERCTEMHFFFFIFSVSLQAIAVFTQDRLQMDPLQNQD